MGVEADSPAWPSGSVLRALAAADRDVLLALGAERTFRPSQTLISEGSRDAYTYLLVRGCAKVLGNSTDGRAVLLSIRVAGDLVGELAALDGKPRSASVVAATPVAARAISQPVFLRYLDGRPHAARVIYAAVITELRRSTTHRVWVNAAPAQVRLALVLSHLVEAHGRPCSDGIRLDVPLSQPELASLVGVSEPTLHRALADLRTRDIIRTEYRHLVVRDPAALDALTSPR
jgi:CRP-like cAMP-binding protein